MGYESFQTTANYYIHKDEEAQYNETVNKFKFKN